MSRELERMRKKTMEKVEAAKNIAQKRTAIEDHINQVENEYGKVTGISQNAPAVIENFDRQFKEKIQLSDSDIKFLFLCTALQCARQYLLTNDKFRTSLSTKSRQPLSKMKSAACLTPLARKALPKNMAMCRRKLPPKTR